MRRMKNVLLVISLRKVFHEADEERFASDFGEKGLS